jgi:hypothetical protein
MLTTEWLSGTLLPPLLDAVTSRLALDLWAYPDVRVLVVRRSARLAGVWAIPAEPMPGGWIARRSARVMPYAAPLLLDQHPQRRRDVMYALLTAVQAEASCIDLPMAPGFHDVTACGALGVIVEWRHTNVLDLNADWRRRYSATVRQHIRAARAAVIVRLSDSADGFTFSRALVQQTPGQVRSRKRFAQRCAEAGRVLCLTAISEATTVGQQLVLIDSSTGYLIHSWFDRNGPRGVPSLLTDTAADILHNRHSCAFLDLEGSVLPAVDYFMSGFGGAVTPYPYIYWHRQPHELVAMAIRGSSAGWPCAAPDAHDSKGIIR